MNAASRKEHGGGSEARSGSVPLPGHPLAGIASRILLLCGQRVMLDADLAVLYGVSTKRLNEQVKRNRSRFPDDFVFQLNTEELEQLNRSQSATGSQRHRDPRFPPYAFTEHGAIQAANVLSSPHAVEMGVHVVRAFVRLRELLASNRELAQRLDELESRIEKKLSTHDHAIAGILEAIRQLMQPPQATSRPIGFVTPKEGRNKPSSRTTRRT